MTDITIEYDLTTIYWEREWFKSDLFKNPTLGSSMFNKKYSYSIGKLPNRYNYLESDNPILPYYSN